MTKIYLFGQRNNMGGGTHFSEFVDAIKSLDDVNHVIEEVYATGKKISPTVHKIEEADISVFFYPTISEQFVRGTIVKWGIFETDTLPTDYLNYLRRSNLVWVPSNWAKDVLIRHGFCKDYVNVVNEGVNPNVFKPSRKPRVGSGATFRFLACGKNEIRKGFDELLLGFKMAFGNDGKTQLHLKADYFWGGAEYTERKKCQLQQQINDLGLNNVTQITGDLSVKDMSSLYSYYDAMVFPSRAEGWGLPLIEALASGLPVVSTFYSGHTEYLSSIKGNFVRLEHQLQSISCPEFLKHWKAGGNWAVATPTEIAKKLIFIKNKHDFYQRKAIMASKVIREKFSWRHAAEQAVSSLQSNKFL